MQACRWCGAAASGADDLGPHCPEHAPDSTDTRRMLALLERIELLEAQSERAETAAIELEAKIEQPDWRRRR